VRTVDNLTGGGDVRSQKPLLDAALIEATERVLAVTPRPGSP
jgi:hypothetical protein